MTKQVYEYDKIADILKRYKTEKLDKVNFYGVITYLGQAKPKNIQLTVVDQSCQGNERLKCNIFVSPDILANTCEVGDIIRCHRFKIDDFNNHAQGVGKNNASQWIRFKRNASDYDYEGSSAQSTFEELDREIVKELREWLKTNPQLNALIEAGLATTASSVVASEDVNESTLAAAASIMNMNPGYFPANRLENLNLVKFEKLQPETFVDIVCQVCAVCTNLVSDTSKLEAKFLSVWDGTKTNYGVFQEQEFKLDTQNAYFSKSIAEMNYHIFVFDEYVRKIESIQPGDYVLFRNARVYKPNNSNADLAIKMPGGGANYHRNILKVASSELNFSVTNNDTLTSAVKAIHDKGKELCLKIVTEDEYRSSIQLNLEDATMCEINANNKGELNLNKRAPSKIDMLLKDDSNAYEMLTDDESTRSTASDETNKENRISPQNNNNNNKAQTLTDKDVHLYRQSLTAAISPIKNSTQIESTLEPVVDEHDNQMIVTQSVVISTSTQKNPLAATQSKSKKKTKKLHPYEICEKIVKIQRLVNWTYLVPYLTCDLDQVNSEASMPFFRSLKHLEQNAQSTNFMRCKVVSKIFKYSLDSCPQVTSVFVNCKKCSYINFSPFQFSQTHQGSLMSGIMKDFKNLTSEKSFNDSSEDGEASMLNDAVNFSLNWIHTAFPNDLEMQAISQVSNIQLETQGAEEKPVYYYSCPRCLLDETDTQLDYIYRFWFILKDAESELNPCLIEGELAERFLGVSPVKFFINKSKAHQVYQRIVDSFEKKYLFTIDVFKLPLENLVNSTRKLNILYKIVDIAEIKPI